MQDGGGVGSGGVVVAGNDGVEAGVAAGADADCEAGVEPLAADGAVMPFPPVPRGACEGAAALGVGAATGDTEPSGASVTDATGTASNRGPSVGTRARLRACTPSDARVARPPSASRATSLDTSPFSSTTSSAVDEASAHTVATLLRRDRARTRRARRLSPEPALAFATGLDPSGSSSSSQKVVFRSQNESAIRTPVAFSSSDDRSNEAQNNPAAAISGRWRGRRRDPRGQHGWAARVGAGETGLRKNTRFVWLRLPGRFATNR